MNFSNKKKLALLSILPLMGAALIGCGQEGEGGAVEGETNNDNSDKTQISMSVWGMPFENELYTQIYIPEFEAQNPDIEVEFIHLDDLRDRYLTLGAAGDLPDVMRSPGGDIQEFINRGMVIPLDSYMESSDFDKNDFPEETWTAMTDEEGTTFAIPQDANATVLYYDPAAFEEAGLEAPDHDYTLDQMMADAQELTKKDDAGNVERYGFVMNWDSHNFINFVLANGGNIWSEDLMTSTVDSPEAVEALEYWRDLVVDFQLTPTASDQAQMGADSYFQAGRAAMFIDGTWIAPSIKNAAPDFNFKGTSFPGGDVKTSRSQSSSFGISKDSEDPEAAWKLLKFLTDKEQLDVYWQSLWVAAPARFSSMQDEEAFTNVTGVPEADVPGIDSPEEFQDKAQVVKDIIDNGWLNQEWVSPYQSYYYSEVDNAIQSVLVDGAEPAEALAEAAENINSSIQQN